MRRRGTLTLSLGLLLVAAGVAAAQEPAPEPRVRARLEPEGPVQVGEPIVLWIEVLVTTWFARAPEYPTSIDVPGALAELTGRSVNSGEREGRQQWSGLRKAYQIVPLTAGRYEIPPVTVTLHVAQPGQPTLDVTVASPPQQFEATVPEAAAGLGYFVPATRFELEQQVEAEWETLAVGSAITRTLRLTAEGATAALLPPHEPVRPEGLAVYPEPPQVVDAGGERGEVRVGSRVDQVTYVIEAPGDYALPPVRIAWWDLSADALRWAEVDGIAFVVSAAAVAEAPPAEDAPASGPRAWWLALPALLVALACAWRPVGRRVGAWRRRRAASAGAAYRELLAAASADDPDASYAALLRWAGRLEPGQALADLLARADVDGLREQVARLERRLFGREASSAAWRGRDLAEAARVARGRLARRAAARPPALPGLEPRASRGRPRGWGSQSRRV